MFGRSEEFNPYIHGTNSQTLFVMAHTEYQLLSPLEAIHQFGVAPLTGELDRKGSCTIPTASNYTSFGRLYNNEYDLTLVIADYTKTRCYYKKTDIASQQAAASLTKLRAILAQKYNSFNGGIKLLTIHLVRYLQVAPEDNTELLIEIKENIKKTIEMHYLFLLLSKHITRNEAELDKLTTDEIKLMCDAIYTRFEDCYEAFSKNSPPSLEEAYTSGDPEKIQAVVNWLEFPQKNMIVKLGHDATPTQKTLPISQPFRVGESDFSGGDTSHQKNLNTLICWWNRAYYFHDPLCGWLEKLVQNDFESAGFKSETILELVQKNISVFKKNLNFIEAINTPASNIKNITLHPFYESKIMQDPFPLVFLYTDGENLKPFNMSKGEKNPRKLEQRVEKSLKLGVDIKMLATDTENNALELYEFLLKVNLFDIEIFLFAQLFDCKTTKIKPKPFKVSEAPAGFYAILSNAKSNDGEICASNMAPNT